MKKYLSFSLLIIVILVASAWLGVILLKNNKLTRSIDDNNTIKMTTEVSEVSFLKRGNEILVNDCWSGRGPCSNEKQITNVDGVTIDGATFSKLYEGYQGEVFPALEVSYFKDKNNVYCFSIGEYQKDNKNRIYLRVVAGADPATFQLFDDGELMQDKNNIYDGCPGRIIANQSAIGDLMRLADNYYYQKNEKMIYKYSRDLNTYYNDHYGERSLTPLSQYGNLNLFKVLSEDYTTNNHKIFYKDEEIKLDINKYTWFDPTTFKLLENGYAGDEYSIFYITTDGDGKKIMTEIVDANYKTFRKINQKYWGDENQIFCNGKVLSKDVTNFIVDDEDWAHDEKNDYYFCDIVPKYVYGNIALSFEDEKVDASQLNDYNVYLKGGITNIYTKNKKTGEKKKIISFNRDNGNYNDVLNEMVFAIKPYFFNIEILCGDQRGCGVGGTEFYVNLKNNNILEIETTQGSIKINSDLIRFNDTGDCCKDSTETVIDEDGYPWVGKSILNDLEVNGKKQKVFLSPIILECGTGDGFCGHELQLGVQEVSDDFSRVDFGTFTWEYATTTSGYVNKFKDNFYFDTINKKVFVNN